MVVFKWKYVQRILKLFVQHDLYVLTQYFFLLWSLVETSVLFLLYLLWTQWLFFQSEKKYDMASNCEQILLYYKQTLRGETLTYKMVAMGDF